MDAIQKFVTVLGAPIALIYAIGVLAQVINLGFVEKTYDFSYLKAWHIVGLMDREYVIGLGVKYLAFSLAVAIALIIVLVILLLVLSWLTKTAAPESFVTKSVTFLTRRLTPEGTAPEEPSQEISHRLEEAAQALDSRAFTPCINISPQKSWFEKYKILLIVSVPVALTTILLWLPLHAHLIHTMTPREPNSVISYLPRIEMSISSSADNPSPYTLEGVFLSRDSEYWYILSLGEGRVADLAVVPLEKANEVRITP